MGERKAVIKNADMSEEMQQDAVDCATQALEKYNIEKVWWISLDKWNKQFFSSSSGGEFLIFLDDSSIRSRTNSLHMVIVCVF